MNRALPWILAAVAAVSAIGAVVSFAAVVGDDDSTVTGWPGSMMYAGAGRGSMMGGWAGAGPVNDIEDARAAAERALDVAGYRGFRVAEVMRFENGAYAAVEERKGVGAFELIVDSQTGAVFPEPGPNMMWNTRYGMMAFAGGAGMGGGMMGGTGGPFSEPDQLLTADRAVAVANEWLAGARPGEQAGEPRELPGYFTLDTEARGEPTGMLSVNAATGAVWFHAWHRGFLDEREW